MALLSFGVNKLVNSFNIGTIRSFRSGTFINMYQSINSDNWLFAVDEASGHNTVFLDLNREDLSNFFLYSNISSGEMILTISHGEISKSFDLSGGAVELSPEDVDMTLFNPGRIEIQLNLINAVNVSVKARW